MRCDRLMLDDNSSLTWSFAYTKQRMAEKMGFTLPLI
jgi:hypothetical protein